MLRRLVAVAGVTSVVSALVWVLRLRFSQTSPAPSRDNFSLSYAAVLKNQKGLRQVQQAESARIMVFYGSSSGNAEDYARSLVADLQARGADVALIDPFNWGCINWCDAQQSLFPLCVDGELPITIFVVSTTGEGDIPTNFFGLFADIKEAVEKVSEDKEKPFAGLMYSVFALGDSSYKYYCQAGIDVMALLHKGGGRELVPIGFGDARNPMRDDAFEEWMTRLIDALQQQPGLTLTTLLQTSPQPKLIFRFTPNEPVSKVPFALPASMLEPSMEHPALLEVKAKIPRTEPRDDDSFVLHLTLSIKGQLVSYQAGDHLGIYPVNPPDVVEAYREVLNISQRDWETPVELCTTMNALARASLRNTLPARVTLQTVFERYLDLCGRPRKSVLRFLAMGCSDLEEKNLFLEHLQRSAKNNEKEEKRLQPLNFPYFCTILDYLKKFPSCCSVSIGHFLEFMPRLQPRFYSIASDIMTHSTTIELFIRIVSDGVNSRYLQSVSVGDRITAFVRKSTFHLPVRCGKRPVIMIASGTGVASMLGFCYRQEALMKRHPDASYGPMILFFGAQKRETEYFPQRELKSWCLHGEGKLAKAQDSSRSLLTLLDLAFSRDGPEKYYVTHLIEKHRDYLLSLITHHTNGGCLIYVSGNASQMAKSVDEALVKLLEYGGITRSAALRFLERMEAERTYLKDVY